MKLISWNVNGLRACIQKGFLDQFQKLDADFFCLQETKLQEGQLTLDLPGYEQYWCYAEKKGYSGTAIFTKHTPISVSYGLGVPELDNEGRVITLEYPEFYLVNCYTPNAQRGLARLAHRMKWDEAYRNYVTSLDAKKPTILCGDLNVAHKEIDLKNPASNRGNAGFSDEERESFSKTLSLGFTDTFRYLNPTTTGAYSWWSYMYHARENNAGWRIDYFLTSDRIRDRIYSTPIYSDVLGSDHCPVGLEMDIPCNGSIWHESAEGQPQVVAEPAKSNSTTVKIISSVLAIVILLGIGAYSLGFIPKSYQNYLTVYHFDQPLTSTLYNEVNSKGYTLAFTDGTTTWPIQKKLNHSLLFSSSSSVAIFPVVETYNVCIRLEMTEKALKSYHEEWTLSVEPVLAEGYTADKYRVNSYAYFSDGDINCTTKGWFICGSLPGNTLLNITLDTGKEQIVFYLNEIPIEIDYERIDAESLDTEDLVYKIVSDPQIQSLLRNAVLNTEAEVHYRKAVEESGYLAELETRYDANGYLLTWFYIGTDSEKWTAYALLSQGLYRNSLTDTQSQTFLFLEESINSISKEDAATLPTRDLLRYFWNLKHFCKEINSNPPYATFNSIMVKFPALEELIHRDDFISVSMQEIEITDLEAETIHRLLSMCIDRMTPEEETLFLLGQYPSSPATEPVVSFDFPESNSSTEEMIKALFQDSGLGFLLLRASSDEVRDELFKQTLGDNQMVLDVIRRDDFVETLLNILASPSLSSDYTRQMIPQAVLHLSVVQDQMNDEQRKVYEDKYKNLPVYILYDGVDGILTLPLGVAPVDG